ncbi:hypothetical protein [Bosea lupini]|uniref:hypothetical protein n=1 Tax=Bosea lupini TaxID=1036779 RepID=UPI0011607949|nr:hypothetical protein [Bosea lupini]
MDRNELSELNDEKLVDLLSLAQHVMAGLTRTLLLVSRTISGENLDGAALTYEAAKIVADMLLAEAAQLRKAGKMAEADVRERAVGQFKMVIRDTLSPPLRRSSGAASPTARSRPGRKSGSTHARSPISRT